MSNTNELKHFKLEEGALLGFKPCPGTSCEPLFQNARGIEGNPQRLTQFYPSEWSGVYVQLDIEQAFRYVPNQFERGEEIACIVALRIAPGQSLNVVLNSDPRMTETSISSNEKARLMREALHQNLTDFNQDTPLIAGCGEKRVALCLMDCEDYEVIIPFEMFNDTLLQSETLFILPQSKRIPFTIAEIQSPHPDFNGVLQSIHQTIAPRDRDDASVVGKHVKTAMHAHYLAITSSWFTSWRGSASTLTT